MVKTITIFLGRFFWDFCLQPFAASSSRGPCRPFFHVTLPARDLSAHRFNLISAPRGPAAQIRYSILPTTRRFPVRILGRVPGRSTELYPPILVGPSSVAALPPLLESIFYISISRNRSWTSFLSPHPPSPSNVSLPFSFGFPHILSDRLVEFESHSFSSFSLVPFKASQRPMANCFVLR